MVNQLVDLESPKNKDFIENNNDEKNVNNNSEKQVINNTVESVDKRMLNIEKAGLGVKILGVANIIYSIILTCAVSSGGDWQDGLIVLVIIFLSVFTYITGSKIKKNINWAKKTGIALCIISFANFPVGFVISIFSLYYLARSRTWKLDIDTDIEKAGLAVKILGVTNIIYSLLIFSFLGKKKDLDNIDLLIAIAIIFLSVLTYITGSKIKKNIYLAKKTGIALCIISFLNIPVGLILSIISLYYLRRGWNDKLD